MTADIFSRVHFTSGEALSEVDLENIGAFAQIMALDRLVGGRVPQVSNMLAAVELPQDASTLPFLITAHPGQARLIQGSANNKIKITNGTVFQAIAAVDGETPAILAYDFPGTDEVTIANAAGATPRVDLIQIALTQVNDTNETRDFEDATTRALTSAATAKRHRTACAITVKQGTPGASPVVPALDSGCVAIATVVVGASYAAAAGFAIDDTAGAVAVIHDQRMPLGVRQSPMVQGGQAHYQAADWTFDPITQEIACTTPNEAWFECSAGDTAGRVIAASTVMSETAAVDCKFYLVSINASGVHKTALNQSNMNGSGAGVPKRRSVVSGIFEAAHAPAAGPTVVAAGGIGVPIWSNGHRAWVDPIDTGLDYVTLPTVALYYAGAGLHVGDRLFRAQFWIAGS